MAAVADATPFAGLALRSELLRALTGLGYEEPTPIQREAIPPLLEGRDLVGQAATGTGKTAAFALPLLQRISRGDRGPRALVPVPTRELAVQVSEAMHRYGRELGARVLPIYGGQPIGRQLQALERGVDVVVATPGRALDHIARGTLRLENLEIVVLDEADEMLDMGFADDIEAILEETPEDRQTVLFSATMPPRIDGMARRHLRDPVRIQLGRKPLSGEAALVRDQLTETLNGLGYRAEALHGGMDQAQRERVMGRLRSGKADLLVATDVAARGLDIEQLTHVVNYDVPCAPESYVHRIGRVGRAGREGAAITLIEPREHRILKAIERATKQRIPVEKLPTVADLQGRRLELTRAALRESRLADDLETFRAVVETLADEFDLMDVALAAVKLAHEASGDAAEQEEIADVALTRERERIARTTRLFVGLGRAAGIRRRTSSALSPGSRSSAAGTSARSRSPSASRSWRCRTRRQTRSSRPCRRARSRERRRRSAGSGSPCYLRGPMRRSHKLINLAAVIIPFLGFVAALALLWDGFVGWTNLAILLVGYVLTGLGITVGFHRLFTHRSFRTGRVVRYAFAVLGSMAVEGRLLVWVADHRKHHQFSDRDGDPHSPHLGEGARPLAALRGLAHAHVGWMFSAAGRADVARYVPDLLADRGLRIVSRLFGPLVVASLLVPFAIGLAVTGRVGGGLTALLWGGLVRIFLLHHVTFSINSICHFWGRRRFRSADESRNVFWLALPSFGEAWHHNHHAFPTSAFHGLRRWEVDPGGLLIAALERLGLAWNVTRIPPDKQARKQLAPASA